MKKLILATCLMVITGATMQAQEKKKAPFIKRTSLEAGLAFATDGTQMTDAIIINQYWGLGNKNRKFKLGLGVRMTNTFGGANGGGYFTAPAKLTSGKTGPSVFFAEQIEKNLDTLNVSSHNVNAVNLFVALHYDFNKKTGIEFNIDVAGFSFGSERNFDFYKTEPNVSAGKGKPTSGNLLLISDNDIEFGVFIVL
jgi:hypothetical protein